MKKFLFLPICMFCLQAFSQFNPIGIWEGHLNIGDSLRIVFHFSKDSSGQLSASMDSPDQAAYDLKADSCFQIHDSIGVILKKMNASFSGNLINDSTMEGFFRQGVRLPLKLKKVNSVSLRFKPQTPQPPFNYQVEEVTFQNADKSIQFGGTLTYPQTKNKRYPGILLITGSGAQNRDEEIMGHKPFHVLADHLTKNGFAVLRVDDRGVGASSGNAAMATTEDFIKDAEAGFEFLRSQPMIDTKHLGLVGHSEGGLIATLLAARNKEIDFIILLAAPGIATLDMMVDQNMALLKVNGMPEPCATAYGGLYQNLVPALLASKDTSEARLTGRKILDDWLSTQPDSILKRLGLKETFKQNLYLKKFTQELLTPWMRQFLQYDPRPYIKKLQCKVLALNGDRDIQVISASNLEGIRQSLKKGKAKHYEVYELKGLNHLFQHCSKCTVQEYGKLDETFAPEALERISQWLQVNVISKP